MAENANHHYVPKFYFRLFNGGKDMISLLVTKTGQVIPCAAIKKQCARHLFYGTPGIEKNISGLEGLHASALRKLIEVGNTGDLSVFMETDFIWLLQAIAFQRVRTLLEVEKSSPAMCSLTLHWFTEDMKRTMPPDQLKILLGVIERGELTLVEDPTQVVLRHITTAMELAHDLVDMRLCVIHNHTDYPFIFSDSPVVFYNTLYRRITDRGVLGYRTPGLQIFLPLTPTLQLMLLDAEAYSGKCRLSPLIDVTTRADVSELNALQLHHSRQVAYFADPASAPYVIELYEAHRLGFVSLEDIFRVRRDLYVDGKPPDGQLLQVFEQHLNYHLSLSFVECTPVSPREYKPRHRTKWEDDTPKVNAK